MKFAIAMLVAAAVVAAGVAGLRSQAQEDGTSYVTAPVESGRIQATVTATGTLKALNQVEVGSQLSGQVAELLVDFNDEVDKGQVMARLDEAGFRARLREAEAALEVARANVGIQQAGLEHARSQVEDAKAQLAVHRARIEKAKARLAAAEADLKRKLSLRDRGAVSAQDLEEAQANRDSATADLKEASAELDVQQQRILAAEIGVKQADAKLENARAAVPEKAAAREFARTELERTAIRAPIDGIVIKRDVDEGQTVAASLEAPTLFTLAHDLREMKVHVKVDEADIGRIDVGQPANFTVDAYRSRRFEGGVVQIRRAPEVVQNVVTYTVVVSTRNPDGLLLPGMTALVEIVTAASEDTVIVPSLATSFTPQSPPSAVTAPLVDDGSADGRTGVVWVLGRNGQPVPRRVVLGLSDGSRTAVLAGDLQPGNTVITGEKRRNDGKSFLGFRFGF